MGRRLITSKEVMFNPSGQKTILSQDAIFINNITELENFIGKDDLSSMMINLAKGVTTTTAGTLVPLISKAVAKQAVTKFASLLSGVLTVFGIADMISSILKYYDVMDMVDSLKAGKQIQIVTQVVRYNTGTNYGYATEVETYFWVQPS